MKLRIKGPSIRMRLNRDEVDRLAADGRVEEVVAFGAAPGERLTYALCASDDVSDLAATYRDGAVTILVPRRWIRTWPEAEQVGFETVRAIDAGGSLHILVEKDFACLHREDEEEDARAYPHPASGA